MQHTRDDRFLHPPFQGNQREVQGGTVTALAQLVSVLREIQRGLRSLLGLLGREVRVCSFERLTWTDPTTGGRWERLSETIVLVTSTQTGTSAPSPGGEVDATPGSLTLLPPLALPPESRRRNRGSRDRRRRRRS
jgi:hypothetical protein